MNTFSASTTDDWRGWLARNCRSEKEVWLVIHHSGSGTPGPRYHEAVEQALCYGWIDSLFRRVDDEKHVQWFSPRRRNSKWSASNIQRVRKLIAQKKMTRAGLEKIPAGALESEPVQRPKELPVPDFLAAALAEHPEALANFNRLAASYRRNYIGWISSAKREETRQKRIAEAITLLERNEKLGMK